MPKRKTRAKKMPEPAPDPEEARCLEWIERAKRALVALNRRELAAVEKRFRDFSKKACGTPLGELVMRWRRLYVITGAEQSEPERRDIEAKIGRLIMEGTFSPLGEVNKQTVRLISDLLKPFPSAHVTPRIDLNRVLQALRGFCRKHRRTPTKQELRAETAYHPLDDVLCAFDEKPIFILISDLENDTSAMGIKAFSKALAALTLSDLPDVDRGNPKWIKKSREANP